MKKPRYKLRIGSKKNASRCRREAVGWRTRLLVRALCPSTIIAQYLCEVNSLSPYFSHSRRVQP